MPKSLLLAILFLALMSTMAHAESSSQYDSLLSEITSVNVTELQPSSDKNFQLHTDSTLGDIITSVDNMIAVGEKIWKIVEANKPIITTKFSPSVSVLPDLEGKNPELNQLTNWSPPKIRTYHVSFTNNSHQELVGFNYTLYFQYNGSYKGHGKYITNLNIKASNINVPMFYNFDATTELVGIANVGSEEAPIASATLRISYTVKNFAKAITDNVDFYVDGTGNIQVIP